uniref:Uncharacterized protein n=1 Tax=Arion vulgaris TaxID=1028688 RepID=A0A0B7A1D7_9EUPU
MVGQAYPEENTVECHYTNTLVQSAREAEKRTPQTGVEMESSCGTEGCWIILVSHIEGGGQLLRSYAPRGAKRNKHSTIIFAVSSEI